MLVLSRKEAERIRLGDDIVITVVRIGGDKVRIGIEAPKDVLVLRDELEAFDKTPRSVPAPWKETSVNSRQPAERLLKRGIDPRQCLWAPGC